MDKIFETISVSDSTAAIDTYRKLKNMFPHELLKLNNSDVWRFVQAVGKEYGYLKMKHTKAHMDKNIEKEHLTKDSIGNIMADKLAGRMHMIEEAIPTLELTNFLTSSLLYTEAPVTMAIRRWMPYMVQIKNSRRYWSTHMPEQDSVQECAGIQCKSRSRI